MPEGLNRSGDFRNGSPITTPHEFDTPVVLPLSVGNPIPPVNDPANLVTWQPAADHFGNAI
jgi:hypothetical protein